MSCDDAGEVGAAFLGARDESTESPRDAVLALGRAITDACARAARQWEGIDLAPLTYGRFIAGRVPPAEPALGAIRSARHDDLYLACACALGDSRAIRMLITHFRPQLLAAVRHLGSTLTYDEFEQELRTRLFVTRDARPAGIASYGGQGPLGAWLRVTSVRLALDLTKADRRAKGRADDLVAAQLGSFVDAEQEWLKGAYAEAFRTAVRRSLGALPANSQLLLRQSLVDGLTTRDLGRIHGVAHTTIVRWIATARTAVLHSVRDELLDRLQVDDAELDSILRLIDSRLDASISQVLGRAPS